MPQRGHDKVRSSGTWPEGDPRHGASPGLSRVPRTPARPGPGPAPAALLRALDLTLHRRVEGVLSGEYRATRLGPGTELAQVRRYEPGDDVRQIDWNVTARTYEPHVRVHIAERAASVWLLLDVSASMVFGTADRRKIDVAEGVALAVGHLATRRGNRLGLVLFGGPAPLVLPPRPGRRGLLGALLALHRQSEQTVPARARAGASTASLDDALRQAALLARRGAPIVMVSDFRGPAGSHETWQRTLHRLTQRHDVLAVEVRDPREQDLPDVGEVCFVDPETGRQLRVDTGRRDLRERFRAAAAAEREQLAEMLRRSGAGHAVVTTSGDWLRQLAAFLSKPAQRARMRERLEDGLPDG